MGPPGGPPDAGVPAEDITGAPMPDLPKAAPAAAAQPVEPPPQKSGGAKLLIPVVIGGGLAFVAVLGLGAWLLFGGDDEIPTDPSASATAAASSAAPAASDTAEEPDDADAGAEDAAPDVEEEADALVTFACAPDCKEVVCDGEKVEDIGDGVRLEEGKHTCIGKRKGYLAAKETFTVEAGNDVEIEMRLRKIRYAPPRPPKPAKTCGTLLNPCK